MSTYVIGDIHGCYQELQKLLKLIKFKPGVDTLISVGDIINKGYDNLSCIQLLMDLDAKTVLGNHELLLLELLNQKVVDKFHNFNDILVSNSLSDIAAWLHKMPFIIHLDEFNTTIVHAGLHPNWNKTTYIKHNAHLQTHINQLKYNPKAVDPNTNPLDFNANCFTRIRQLDDNLCLDMHNIKPKPGLTPWFNLYKQPETVIFGHWAYLNGVTNNPKTINIDTGCVYSRKLTCIRLEDNRKFYVSNHRSKNLK